MKRGKYWRQERESICLIKEEMAAELAEDFVGDAGWVIGNQ